MFTKILFSMLAILTIALIIQGIVYLTTLGWQGLFIGVSVVVLMGAFIENL